MSFEIGQIAGGYEFVSVQGNTRIGRGYKVRNVLAERLEVLRVLPKEPNLGREEVDRFLREIKVHARLSHPNIVSFYTATEIESELVMTSEFFDGITLEQRLLMGRIPLQETVVCMSQVLSALNYAHEMGVVHREVSPANILLGSDGTVKLTGFGMAKSSADPEVTQVGTVMGWLEYMSPEQVKGLPSLDARTDIYSAGVVLYEMATGQIPFVRKNQFDLMMAHVNAAPPPPLSLKPDLSLELSHVILKAIEKEPADRFQTAAQFRDALGRLAAPPQPEPTPVIPETLPEPEGWTGRRLVMAGVFTFLLVIVAALALLKLVRP